MPFGDQPSEEEIKLLYKGLRSTTLSVAASDTQDTSGCDYICDGTDDQVEINQAIAALPAGGGLIHLLKGTYNVTARILIDKSNVAILGTGANTVITIPDGTNAIMNIIEATNFDNILIKDLHIDGNAANNPLGAAQGITFNTVTHSKIVNCWVENTVWQVNFQASSNNTIVENTFFTGGGIQMAGNSDYNTIIGNTILVAGQIRIAGSDFNTVDGNMVATGDGIGINLLASSRNTITNNIIHDKAQTGIRLELAGTEYNLIAGNIIHSSGTQGIWLLNADHNTVVGNSVERSETHGILVQESDHNNISDNTVCWNSQAADNTYDGIQMTTADYNNVQGNMVRTDLVPNRHQYGIDVSNAASNGNVVVNNDLFQSGQTGGYNDAGGATRGTPDGQWPVPIPDTHRVAADLVVAADDTLDSTRSDYQCGGVSDETVINAAITALGARGGTVKLLRGTFVVDGPIILTSNVALVGQGAGTVITIPDGHDAAIRIIYAVNETHVLVKDLLVDGNRANQAAGVGNGIYFDTAMTHSRVEGCWIRNMYGGGSAISLVDANNYNIISNNNIHDNGGYGIILSSDCHNNMIVDNEIINNGLFADATYDGIQLNVNSDYNSIQGNLIRTTLAANRHRYGINIAAATCTLNLVKDNDLYQSGFTGLFNDAGTDTRLPSFMAPIFDDQDANASLGSKGAHVSIEMADNQDVHVRFNFRVPDDFHQLVRARIVVVPDGTGNLNWGVVTEMGECGFEYNTADDSIALHVEAVTTDIMECLDINAGLDGIPRGGHVGVNFQRDSAAAADTVGAVVHVIMFWMEYV